jgi:ectoine hydroxylase-related dioxygenase (phytanoyl-CoA dioxygenase family)
MLKALTQAQRDFYDREGYLCPLPCLTAEAAGEARASLTRFRNATGMSAGDIVFKGHLAFPWSFELASHPAILNPVEDIVGPNILVFASKFWIKEAGDGGFVTWHQDSAYFGIEPVELASVWVALTDSTPANGCVRAIPGTHKGPTLRHVERKGDRNLLARGQRIDRGIDETAAVDFVLRVGEFSMHDVRLVHGSLPNEGAGPRIGLAFFYIPAHVRSTIGRRSAHLVRGEDAYRHWDPDPAPRFDGDPRILEHAMGARERYVDESVPQEAEVPNRS